MQKDVHLTRLSYLTSPGFPGLHPEGTSIGSDNCDFLKVSDFNRSL